MSTPQWSEVNAKMLAKIPFFIGQLRQKYETERSEIAHEVQEHLQSMRLAQSNALDTQSHLMVAFEELTMRLDAMENASIDPQSDLATLIQQTNALNASIKACQEEQQLLKAAIYHDRLIHDEERVSRTIQEEHLHLRIKQAEESSEMLREHLHQWQSVNSAVMENGRVLMQFVDDNHIRHGQQNLLTLQKDVLTELAQVKAAHKDIMYKIKSMHTFVERQEAERQMDRERDLEVIRQLRDDIIPASSKRHTLGDSVQDAASVFALMKQQYAVIDAAIKSHSGATAPSEEALEHISPVKMRPTKTANLHSPATLAGLSAVINSQVTEKSPKLSTSFSWQLGSHGKNKHDALRSKLERFYAVYNPSKIQSIDEIISEYSGAEEELLAALEVHYGAVGYFSSVSSL